MEPRQPTADEQAGMQWWNSLTEAERAQARPPRALAVKSPVFGAALQYSDVFQRTLLPCATDRARWLTGGQNPSSVRCERKDQQAIKIDVLKSQRCEVA